MMKLQPTKLVLALLLVVGVSFAGRPFEFSKDKLQKTTTTGVWAAIDINNIFNYYINNGDGALNPYTADDGFEIMSANRGQVLFEEGFLWGGVHKGLIKIGGSDYNHGLQAGPIVTAGVANAQGVLTQAPVAANAGDKQYHVYKTRPDIGKPGQTIDQVQGLLNEEIAKLSRYENTTAAQLFANYQADWAAWPAAQGAPFKDVNGNGVYDAGTDIPGVAGADQTLWYVANDLDTAIVFHLHGSKPIGIEFQRTIWAYNRTGAIGNTIFQKNIIINKSGFKIDSMFVQQWADPDIGGSLGYTDDFSGCDTIRSLGFTYNGTNSDGFFGATPPAFGFDFFQGPRVFTGNASDVAIWKGAKLPKWKNLGMTGFNFAVNSSSVYADPALNAAAGTQEAYNLMNGFVGRTGAAYVNPKTGLVTKYVLSGDPVTGKGWLDGTIAPPGDRRMSQASGPFTMAAGDTQEVVVGAMAAQSISRLASVALLKYYDDLAQSAYDAFFAIPQPPAQPVVDVIELDKKIVFDWSNADNYPKTESQNENGYKFEGYNVYQLPANGFANQKLLATYDLVDGVYTLADQVFSEQYGTTIIVPVENGSDNGISRYFIAEKDYINDKPFVNGQKYYFAVTAYNYNPDPKAVPVTLETAAKVMTVTPQSTANGVRLSAGASDTLKVTHTSGSSDGAVMPLVLDPTTLTGDTYKVSYDTAGGKTFWSLTDVTKSKVLLANQANQSGDNDYAGVDGLLVKVTGPLLAGMKGWTIPNGARVFSPVGGFTGLGLEGFSTASDPTAYNTAAGTIGMAGHLAFGGIGTTLPISGYKNVLLKFAATDTGANLWNPLVKPADANFSKGYRYLRNASAAAASPSFSPWLINKTSGYPYQDFNYSVPFSAWDMETTPPTRLAVGMFENNAAGASVDGRYWPPTTTGDNTVNREFAFIFDKPYSETVDPTLAVNMSSNASTPLMWVITCARRTANPWTTGNEFLIQASHLSTKADVFTFTAAAPVVSAENAKIDINQINVFPNPYFGFNSKEANKYNKFVTFNHLPSVATLNIMNLAGVRVRTLLKNDPTQFMNWDLKNEQGLPVAAGMYIVYIDMGSIGTKIVKLAIIPEVQQLDKY